MAITDIKFIRNAFLPVLPLVYDDALSYIEQLGKISKKINEVIDAMNNLDVQILGEAEAYTNARISEVYTRINGIVSEVNSIVNALREDNEEFIREVTNEVNELVAEVNGFNQALVATANAINERTDLVVQQNNETLLATMERYLANIKVLNYITGEEMTVQGMFDYLCKFHLTDALTYTELVAKNVTYSTLINYQMTYTQLITNGGSIIQ